MLPGGEKLITFSVRMQLVPILSGEHGKDTEKQRINKKTRVEFVV